MDTNDDDQKVDAAYKKRMAAHAKGMPATCETDHDAGPTDLADFGYDMKNSNEGTR